MKKGNLRMVFLIAGCLMLLFFSCRKKPTGPEEHGHGEVVWERYYGGSMEDVGYSVKETSDGVFIICGYTYSFGEGENDVYVIKTSMTGDKQWSRTYGSSSFEEARAVAIASNGNFVLVGEAYSMSTWEDVYLLMLDSGGDTLWTRTFGKIGFDWARDVISTSDGNFILSGAYTEVGLVRDVYILKFDSLGDTIWSRTYNYSLYEEGTSIQQTNNGGYVIAGYTRSSGTGDHDVILLRTGENGDALWTKQFGDSGFDEGYEIIQAMDGGFTIVGVYEKDDNSDVYLIKTDSDGETIWTNEYDLGTEEDIGFSVLQTADGGYIIAGTRGSIAFIMKTDANGDMIWTEDYFGRAFYSVIETSDGYYVATGQSSHFSGGDLYLVKIHP